MIKKSELQFGDIVLARNNKYYMYLNTNNGPKFVRKYGYISGFKYYTEDLNYPGYSDLQIVKVFRIYCEKHYSFHDIYSGKIDIFKLLKKAIDITTLNDIFIDLVAIYE